MQYETLSYRLASGIGEITLERPDVMNAMNARMRAELVHVLNAAQAEARVLVLTGKGHAFCAGQDMGDTGNLNNLNMERLLRDEYAPILRAIADAPMPVIAAVNGAASGAGASLALACDLVIAAKSASFTQAAAKIGLIPDAGATYHLPRQVGFARAMGQAFFAERISAQDAADMGMIWAAIEDDSFDAHWRARAAQLAEGPTMALSGMKRAIRASFDNDLDAQMMLESRVQGECGSSRDFKEGVLAFQAKRDAKFQGR